MCVSKCDVDCKLGFKFNNTKQCFLCECRENSTIISTCNEKIFKGCRCDLHKILVENQITLMCDILEIKVFLITINMIVDKFSRVVTFHNLNGIWTVAIILKNSLTITGNLLVDCETLTPYPLIRNMDNTGILYVPLGRDLCEDPIFILCIRMSQEQPCRCLREGYRPPILSITCTGNNFKLMMTHFYDLRSRILQVFSNKKLLDCAITTIQITFEDKLVDKGVSFVDCETKKQLIFRSGSRKEIIVAFPFKASICLTNESTLGDMCGRHYKDFPCKCVHNALGEPSKMEIQCLGNDTEIIINAYNKLQKEIRKIEGWEVRYEKTLTLLSFPEMPKLIEPLGFCKNSSSFAEVVRDDRIAMQVPVGVDVCGRTIESICDYYPLKAPCKCDLTKVKRNSKALHFECEGSNISSIIDTYNEAQTELTKVQMTNHETEFNLTKWTIINTTVLDVEIGDCSTLRKIKPSKQTSSAQEFIIPVGVQTCPTNTKGFCTTISDRQPCRCTMATLGNKIEPNFVCQGLSLNEMLKDSNTLRRELFRLSKKHRDIANFVQVTLEDFRVLPEIYDCESKTLKYREMEGNSIYTKVKEPACTKDMLESGDFYGPEPRQKHPSRIDYLKAGLIQRTYKKKKRSAADNDDDSSSALSVETHNQINKKRETSHSNYEDKFILSKNALIIGGATLAILLTILIGSAITMVIVYRKKVANLGRHSYLGSNGHNNNPHNHYSPNKHFVPDIFTSNGLNSGPSYNANRGHNNNTNSHQPNNNANPNANNSSKQQNNVGPPNSFFKNGPTTTNYNHLNSYNPFPTSSFYTTNSHTPF